MRVLYFDCSCGASGDMIVGALIDAGADFDALRKALLSLSVPGFDVSVSKVVKHGITATQFSINIEHEHEHGHGHVHEHAHRHLEDIFEIIERADLPAEVKDAAASTFHRIAECEAKIHGKDIEEVHFHEVGAIDSIADIIGAHFAMHQLGVSRVLASPLNVGSGTVHTAHGVMPVPVPATVALLGEAEAYGSDVAGELVTPTGAALISEWAAGYGPMPHMRVEKIGSGCGTRDIPDRANILRAIIGETAGSLPETEPICVIEANIDDMNPELLPPLVADLIAKGARDAFLTPLLGKKGRPAFLLTVLCDEDKLADVTPHVFFGSTTFGVRIRTDQRICLEREWRNVKTPWGRVRVKVGRFQGQMTCLSPEFEDCQKVADERRISVLAVYEWAHAAAVKGELEDA